MKDGDPIIWLRFIGEGLDLKALPIYELGSVLIAFQRIIHKAYLNEKDNLTKGAQLSSSERKNCALQISAHRKSSDAYGLIPFMTDPAVIKHIKILLVDGVVALGTYAIGKVVSKKKHDPPVNQYLIGSIYNEVTTINDRIGNIGGVEKIEIRGGSGINVKPVTFDEKTRDYVRQLKDKTLLGETKTIKGVITKLYPNRPMVEIKVKPNYYTKVFLNESDFDVVRYQTQAGDIVKFTGKPIYRFGQKTMKIREFQAVSVEKIK